jgi:hypothetical protein
VFSHAARTQFITRSLQKLDERWGVGNAQDIHTHAAILSPKNSASLFAAKTQRCLVRMNLSAVQSMDACTQLLVIYLSHCGFVEVSCTLVRQIEGCVQQNREES